MQQTEMLYSFSWIKMVIWLDFVENPAKISSFSRLSQDQPIQISNI